MRNNQQLRSTQENGLNPPEWLSKKTPPSDGRSQRRSHTPKEDEDQAAYNRAMEIYAPILSLLRDIQKENREDTDG